MSHPTIPATVSVRSTITLLQRDLQKALAEIHSLKTKVESLESIVDPEQVKLIQWIDKSAFVTLLEEQGLMEQARQYSSKKRGDNKRFLDRLMRELNLFAVWEGAEPPAGCSKQVWRVSERKLLFHRDYAVTRFKQMIRHGRERFAN